MGQLIDAQSYLVLCCLDDIMHLVIARQYSLIQQNFGGNTSSDHYFKKIFSEISFDRNTI